jgi:hypothetical protein
MSVAATMLGGNKAREQFCEMKDCADEVVKDATYLSPITRISPERQLMHHQNILSRKPTFAHTTTFRLTIVYVYAVVWL